MKQTRRSFFQRLLGITAGAVIADKVVAEAPKGLVGADYLSLPVKGWEVERVITEADMKRGRRIVNLTHHDIKYVIPTHRVHLAQKQRSIEGSIICTGGNYYQMINSEWEDVTEKWT